jgi:hypothetical protein
MQQYFSSEFIPIINAQVQICKAGVESLRDDIQARFVTVGNQIETLPKTIKEQIMPELQEFIRAEVQVQIADSTKVIEDRIITAVELRTQQIIEEAVTTKAATISESSAASYEVLDNKINEVISLARTLERNELSLNCVLKGVVESSGEPHLAQVKSLFAEGSIVESRRLGKFDAGAKQPRPVLIKFCSLTAKHAAFKHAKELRAKKIIMDDHLTKEELESRARKQPWAATLRENGYKFFWRRDTLFKVQEGQKPLKVEAPPTPTSSLPTAARASTSRGA